MFVAIAHGSAFGAYSTDGVNWIQTRIGDKNYAWQAVCYGNGAFVAAYYSGKRVGYSWDGIHWRMGLSDTYQLENTVAGMNLNAPNGSARHVIVDKDTNKVKFEDEAVINAEEVEF